jgi:hypothetical protein
MKEIKEENYPPPPIRMLHGAVVDGWMMAPTVILGCMYLLYSMYHITCPSKKTSECQLKLKKKG